MNRIETLEALVAALASRVEALEMAEQQRQQRLAELTARRDAIESQAQTVLDAVAQTPLMEVRSE